MEQRNYTVGQLTDIAQWIITHANSKIICFYGEMGAGKTTIIKELVRNLGGMDSGNSPTFGIVNEYRNGEGSLLGFHFDCYRLNDETEAYDLGFEEYIMQDAWVFIEWPEKIQSLLPEDTTDIKIEVSGEKSRTLHLS